MFWQWVMMDARWYQFWMPQSGWSGGMIAGTVLMALLSIIAVVTELLP